MGQGGTQCFQEPYSIILLKDQLLCENAAFPSGGPAFTAIHPSCGWDCTPFLGACFLGVDSSRRSRASTFRDPSRSQNPLPTSQHFYLCPGLGAVVAQNENQRRRALTQRTWGNSRQVFRPHDFQQADVGSFSWFPSWESPRKSCLMCQPQKTLRHRVNDNPQEAACCHSPTADRQREGKVRGRGMPMANNPAGKGLGWPQLHS